MADWVVDPYTDIEDIEDSEEEEETHEDEEDEIELQKSKSATFLGYNFGDTDRDGAERKLREGNTPGSFLIRENHDGMKLSWISFRGKMKHARLYQKAGKFFTDENKKFNTVQSLIKHYQALDPKSSDNALGAPKMNIGLKPRARSQELERQSKIIKNRIIHMPFPKMRV